MSKEEKLCPNLQHLGQTHIKNCIKITKRFKSERHDVYTEEINKITLISNDDKRLQTFDRITSYRYGTSAGKVCKTELLSKYKWLILMIILMKVK